MKPWMAWFARAHLLAVTAAMACGTAQAQLQHVLLEVHVQDENGYAPTGTATVLVRRLKTKDHHIEPQPAPGGHVQFPDLAQGEYEVCAYTADRCCGLPVTDLQDRKTPIWLTIIPGTKRRLQCTVIGPPGAPLTGATVRLENHPCRFRDPALPRATINAAGQLDFEDVVIFPGCPPTAFVEGYDLEPGANPRLNVSPNGYCEIPLPERPLKSAWLRKPGLSQAGGPPPEHPANSPDGAGAAGIVGNRLD
ncbi:MAG: hypothetical protein ABSD27_05675 [Bryobacteraceae bacterium]|jgi:hypothetical protein